VSVLPSSSNSGFPELTFVLVEDLWIDLAPLFPLSHRTSLFVSQELPESQLSVVKQMRSLVGLSLNHGGPVDDVKDLLALLAEEPHQLQRLEKISTNFIDLDDEMMQGLITLPNLTELEPATMEPNCFPLLRSFSKLRTLHLRPTGGSAVGAAEASALLSSLRAMPDLTSFEFRHWAEEDSSQSQSQTSVLAFLQPLLDGLGTVAPQLRELSLSDCGRLPRLHGLRTCTQLRKLKLCSCFRAAASDTTASQSSDDVLQLLQSLRHLERIEVDSCNLPLTGAQRTQLMPLCFSWS
jgi:hypothetical protein